MTIKNGIRPNEELYREFKGELIPLNRDGVVQREQFFKEMYNKYMRTEFEFEYFKAWKFWEGIKEKHCEVSDE